LYGYRNDLPVLPVNQSVTPPSPFVGDDEDIEAPPTPFEVPFQPDSRAFPRVLRHIRCAYAKDATQALYAYWRSSPWSHHVRKVANKWSSHNNPLFGALLRSHDDAMLHLKIMSRGPQASCMLTVVHRSCTLSFLNE
jgi:hypothetical protein